MADSYEERKKRYAAQRAAYLAGSVGESEKFINPKYYNLNTLQGHFRQQVNVLKKPWQAPTQMYGSNTLQRQFDPFNVWGSNPNLRGKIDQAAGTVNVKGRGSDYDQAFTNYLRGTGPKPTGGGGAFSKLNKQIEKLHKSGYKWEGEGAATPQATPTAGGAVGAAGFAPTANPGLAVAQQFVQNRFAPPAAPMASVAPVRTMPVASGAGYSPGMRPYADGGAVKKRKKPVDERTKYVKKGCRK